MWLWGLKKAWFELDPCQKAVGPGSGLGFEKLFRLGMCQEWQTQVGPGPKNLTHAVL